jgi:hypothetical protein
MFVERHLRSIVFLAGSLAIPFTASGAPIQFRMTGTIDVQHQVGPLPTGFFQGGPFEAILAYDLAELDQWPDDPQRGYYSSANDGDNSSFLIIRAGESEIRNIDELAFFVGNDVDQPQNLFEFRDDTFGIRGAEFQGNFEHSRIASMKFLWSDPTRSVFDSDGLPTHLDSTRFFDALSLNAQQFIQPFIEVGTFQFDSRAHQFTFRAFVNSIEVIPEPTAFSTLILAVTIAPFVSRHRRGDR